MPLVNPVFDGVGDTVFRSVFTGGATTPPPADPTQLFLYAMDGTDGLTENNSPTHHIAPFAAENIGTRLDGVNQNVDAGTDSGDWGGLQTGFGCGMWLYTSDTSAAILIGVGTNTAAGTGFSIEKNTSGQIIVRSNGSAVTTTDSIADDGSAWTQVIVNYDGAEVSVYFGNSLDSGGAQALTFNTISGATFKIGSNAAGSASWYKGDIDAVALYDGPMTASQRAALVVRTDFSPADITTRAWYDANDFSTITDTLGAVSQWDDKSDIGTNDMVQASGGSQPTTETESRGGLNVIDFDGTEYLEKTSMTIGTNGDFTMYSFCNPELRAATGDSHISGDSAGVDFQIDADTTASQFKYRLNIVTSANINGSADYENSWDIMTMDCDFTGDVDLSRYMNGAYEDGQDYDAALDNSQDIKLMSGRATARLQGLMAEVVFTNNSGDTTEREKIEGYLAWKWDGSTNTLDAGHTYKSAPPTA